ncbi:hypothetical protein CAC42_5067 [Sphaceloma murrayae]|uniref:Uncharacterized protein n=1 Tax=Sphaceloma murrayae TaxID=2082308 RepID=A0A2K1QTY3_9PEZI|nr:hypothetical protein CAC42_5067 [Sphaceloma murrayae]
MARHSRQGSDDSPGTVCIRCHCTCNRFIDSNGDPSNDMIISDNDSVTSEDPGDINQPDREPTPGLEARQAQPRYLRPLPRYPQATPPEFIRDAASWNDIVQLLGEWDRLQQHSQPSTAEASFVTSTPHEHDDMYEYPSMTGSLCVEASSRSPMSSMESSMYMSLSSSSSRVSSRSLPVRSNSNILFEGIGALFEQQNWFIASPLQLGPDPGECLTGTLPSRSLSLPAIKLDHPLDTQEQDS